MVAANPLWRAPRIHGELKMLGIAISERTVSRLLRTLRRPPNQTWRTVLHNHVGQIVSTGRVDWRHCPVGSAYPLLPRIVKKLERAEEKEHMMVRFDEEDPSGAPARIRNRDGESAASAAE
jgi:hypothetical protein